jgi:hypothetical protein
MTETASAPFKRIILRAILNDVSPIVARVIAVPDNLEISDLHEGYFCPSPRKDAIPYRGMTEIEKWKKIGGISTLLGLYIKQHCGFDIGHVQQGPAQRINPLL